MAALKGLIPFVERRRCPGSTFRVLACDPKEDRFVSGFDITLKPMCRSELINGAGGRRRWSADDKVRILEETLVPGAPVSE